MALKKPDTTQGFHPSPPSGPDILGPSLTAVRLDGALERSQLSPQIHQVLLGINRVRNAVSSFRLEGERVELDRARQVLATRKPESPAERGILQLAQAYRDVSEGKLPEFSVDGFQDAHRRLFRGVLDEKVVGKIRTHDNAITDTSGSIVRFEPTPAVRVREELDALVEWMQSTAGEGLPSVVAAIFFSEFEAIHPFPNGNGRLGRFLNIALLKRLGFRHAARVPLDTRFFDTSDRYYECLARTSSGRDYTVWTRYYVTELRAAYEAAYRRGDLRKTLARFRRPSTHAVLAWALLGEGEWFRRGDFPNPKRYSGPALWYAFQDLVEHGVLEKRGEGKGREYRLRSKFLVDEYGRMA